MYAIRSYYAPSQWLNIWHFGGVLLLAIGAVAGGLFFPPAWALLVVALLWALWRYLVVRCQRFLLTSERILV